MNETQLLNPGSNCGSNCGSSLEVGGSSLSFLNMILWCFALADFPSVSKPQPPRAPWVSPLVEVGQGSVGLEKWTKKRACRHSDGSARCPGMVSLVIGPDEIQRHSHSLLCIKGRAVCVHMRRSNPPTNKSVEHLVIHTTPDSTSPHISGRTTKAPVPPMSCGRHT